MSSTRQIDDFTLLALETAKFHLETARDSCQRAGATRTLQKIRSALKSLDGAIPHAQRVAQETQDPLIRARRLLARFPIPKGDPPPDACGGSEDEPVDGWCLIEVAAGLFEIQPDFNCPRDGISNHEDALAWLVDEAERTGEQRYIDALRWHLRDADEIARLFQKRRKTS